MRVPYKESTEQKAFLRRAVIATIDENSDNCSVFLEGAKRRRFLFAPQCIAEPLESEFTFSTNGNDVIHSVSENEQKFYESGESTLSTEELKEKADSLLVMRDPASAVEYYEEALKSISKIQIGGYVAYNKNGHAIIAEVDCVDSDDDTVDVTLLESGEEEILSTKKIIMGIHLQQEYIILQCKILLNMTRCFLFLVDIESNEVGRTSQVQSLRKAAVKSTTLSLSCCSLIEDETLQLNLEAKIRYLRAKAYCDSGKFDHARNDLRLILKNDPKNKAALSLMDDLGSKVKQKKKQDRALAKGMCRWIDKVTNENEDCVEAGENKSNNDNSVLMKSEQHHLQEYPRIVPISICLLILVLSIYIGNQHSYSTS